MKISQKLRERYKEIKNFFWGGGREISISEDFCEG